MSFLRFVYYSAVIGGWSAFVGWLIGEIFFYREPETPYFAQMCIGALVGAAIGSGLNLVAGSSNLHWKQLLPRMGQGLFGGGIGGLLGFVIGGILFFVSCEVLKLITGTVPFAFEMLFRGFGWMLMGACIGAVEGVSQRSPDKFRKGLIGGSLGGLIGGLLFNPLSSIFSSGTGMTSRATAFVILGVFIGLLIGLAQVILKQAWLTVVDGYRPGRQLILSQAVTYLGRGDHLPLPFYGSNNTNLESEHVKVTWLGGEVYQVEDNGSKLGSLLNEKPLTTAVQLKDKDMIKLGGNFVRFNLRTAGGAATETATPPQPAPTGTSRPIPPIPPPPPRQGSNQAITPVATGQATVMGPPSGSSTLPSSTLSRSDSNQAHAPLVSSPATQPGTAPQPTAKMPPPPPARPGPVQPITPAAPAQSSPTGTMPRPSAPLPPPPPPRQGSNQTAAPVAPAQTIQPGQSSQPSTKLPPPPPKPVSTNPVESVPKRPIPLPPPPPPKRNP